ncbi:MAG: hypothetical protein QW366_01010 [Sulfolobales archaeon]
MDSIFLIVMVYSVMILSLLSAVLFLVLSSIFIRMYRIYPDEIWIRISLGFILLAISQATILLSIVLKEARILYALFVSTPAFAVSGAYMLWSSRRSFNTSYMISITSFSISLQELLRILPSALDLLAGIFILAVGLNSRRFIRLGFVLVSVSYIVRSIWFLSPTSIYALSVLLIAEIIRSFGALIMTAGYLRRSIL